MTNFKAISNEDLAAITGGKKSKSKQAAAPALGPTMQGALTKGGFQFSVSV